MDSYWIPIDSYGFPWIPAEFLWMALDTYGSQWIPMDSYVSLCIPLNFPSVPIGFLWIPVDFLWTLDSFRVPTDSCGSR